MAGKKGAVAQLQVEVTTEEDWQKLLTKEGLIVADVYSEWCGPCVGMIGILRKIKLEIGGDLLVLATAKSDAIQDLARFRNRSEPTWMFIAGGQMVNLMFGANAPRLVRMIVAELENEKLVQAGERERQTMPFDQLTEEELILEEKKEAKRLEALARQEAEKAAEEERLLKKSLADLERFMTDYTVVVLRPELLHEDGRCEALEALMVALAPDGYKVHEQVLVDVSHPLLMKLMPSGAPQEEDAERPEGDTETKKGEFQERNADVEMKVDEGVDAVGPAGSEQAVAEEGGKQDDDEEEQKEVGGKSVVKLLKMERERSAEESDAPSEVAETRGSQAEGSARDEGPQLPDALERVHQLVYVEMPLTDDDIGMGIEKTSLVEKFCADIGPCLWTPTTPRQKAEAILEFFPEVAARYIEPEPEPLPPHVTLMFDMSKAKAVVDLAAEHSEDILNMGFFSGPDPDSATLIASTLQQYERLRTKGGGETLVLVINRTHSEPLLSFCQHTPFYISPNVEDGARLREAFFPLGSQDHHDPEKKESEEGKEAEEPEDACLLIPEDDELDLDPENMKMISPEHSAVSLDVP